MSHNNIERRSGKRQFGGAVLGIVLLLFVLLLSPASARDYHEEHQARLQSMPRSLTFTFKTPEQKISINEEGNTSIAIDGFHPSGLPGDPELPAALYTIALPPLVPLETVSLEIKSVEQKALPGSYQIASVGPYLPASDNYPTSVDWGPNEAAIVEGKNMTIYGKDAYYQADPVELAGVAHLRKWRVAKLRYWPVSYNPVSGQIRLTTEVKVTVNYDAPHVSSSSLAELQDILADDRAAEIFLNFNEANTWYNSILVEQPDGVQAKPGYAIITTNQIAEASPYALGDFVSHKEAEGYNVLVVTETDYGSYPGARADQVRKWLVEHYESDRENLLYALLIGNPDPLDGDMPMKIVNDVPTDFAFADLNSTLPDLDWEADVYVGRIPVYQSYENWSGILDSILGKTIAYNTSSDLAWRKTALLPMAFLSVGSDGAELAELMKTEYLDPAGFSTHRMYWHGTRSHSSFNGEEELVDGAVRARLQSQPAGILALYGHGNKVTAAIYDEYFERSFTLGDILHSSETQYLDNSHPTLTFQISCKTGMPEVPDNLGYALLKNGAVGTISGSRDTYGWPGIDPNDSAHNVSLAYKYVKHLTENAPTGKALYWVKNNPGGYTINARAYNLYGDPSVQLLGGPLNGTEISTGNSSSQERKNAPTSSANTVDIDEVFDDQVSAIAPTELYEGLADSGLTAVNPSWFSVNNPERILSLGAVQGCGIKADGDVDCWGDKWGWTDHWKNAEDQPGPYTQVSAAQYHSCGLKANGSVHCWGRDDFDLGVDQDGPYVQISSNYLHVCGLTPDGSIDCWGNNEAGQAEDMVGSYIQVSTGMQHTCGLWDDGDVECWGRNAFGQANDRSGDFVQIDAGFHHTCGLRADGSIDCWGSNHHGQAADKVGPFSQVSTGWFHTCGLKRDGSAECWGKISEGHPGPFVRISAFYNNCGLKPDGDLSCWGWWMEDQEGPFGQYHTKAQRLQYTAQPYGINDSYTAVHLADMDGDGDQEVLIGNRDTDELEIWLHDIGSETLVKLGAIEFMHDIHDIKAADFDEDGDIDMVVGVREWGLYYAANTGEPGTVGSWDIKPIDEDYSWQVLVADFDKDDNLDIFHGVDNGPIKTFYGDGEGNFAPGKSVEDPETAMRFASGFNPADLNEDGWLDLTGADGSFMRAFLNPGNRSDEWVYVGSYTPTGAYPCCDPTALQSNLSPSAGDFDGDGVIDQVAFLGTPGSPGPVDLLLFKGSRYLDDMAWETKVVDSILYPGYAGHAGIADLDGDGNLDIHMGGWSQFDNLHLYFGNGRGGFTPETLFLGHGVGEFNSIATGDLNYDGILDFVTNRYDSSEQRASGFEILYGSRPQRFVYLPLTIWRSP